MTAGARLLDECKFSSGRVPSASVALYPPLTITGGAGNILDPPLERGQVQTARGLPLRTDQLRQDFDAFT